ncbi:unnamed protein product [Pylaiella littoralis]
MAAVSPDEEPVSEEHRQDRAQRALRVAVVAGFIGNSQRVQESCLVLCNACREGVPLECRLGKGVPATLLAMFLPHASQAQLPEAPPTRVLQPRRVRKVEFTQIGDVFFSMDFAGVDMSKVQWPEGTKEIRLLQFDRTVDDVTWPVNLDRLSFCVLDYKTNFCTDGSSFNHPLSNVIFPGGLREIFLGELFDQPIDDVAWPQGLERMSLPGFNQPIDDVRWPPALKSLEFMPPKEIQLRKNPNIRAAQLDIHHELGYNCHFTNLPASLETLWLSDAFSQNLDEINWPPGLVTLGLGIGCEPHVTDDISWPSSLRHIYSMHEIDEAPQGCVVTTVTDYDTESQSYEMEMEDAWVHGDAPDEGSCSDVYEDDDCPFTGFAADSDYEGYDSPIM